MTRMKGSKNRPKTNTTRDYAVVQHIKCHFIPHIKCSKYCLSKRSYVTLIVTDYAD